MVLPVGRWQYEGRPLVVTKERIAGIIQNFNAGNPAKVTVPIGHKGFEDATKNTGYVRALTYDPTPVVTQHRTYPEGGAYALIEFTNPEASKLAAEGSIPDVSVQLADGWEHPETGKDVGEVLEHVCITQHPFIQGMPGFEVIQAELVKQGVTAFDKVVMLEYTGTASDNKGDSSMSAEAKIVELEQRLAKQATDLEAMQKIVEGQTSLEKKFADLEKAHTDREKKLDEERVLLERQNLEAMSVQLETIMAGQSAGARFGLPKFLKTILLEILSQSTGKTLKLESKNEKGETITTEKPLRTTLLDALMGLTKNGLPSRETLSTRTDADGGKKKTAVERYRERQKAGKTTSDDKE
jgi:uncharacterized coiled-coil protein SlyX